eukprot:1153067-Pelagomonas_calceolata.AAC.2
MSPRGDEGCSWGALPGTPRRLHMRHNVLKTRRVAPNRSTVPCSLRIQSLKCFAKPRLLETSLWAPSAPS